MAKQWVLIGFLCITSAQGIAQHSQVIDSLERVLEGKDAEERFPVLYQMVFRYISKDNKEALNIIEKAEEAARAAQDSLWIVKSRRVKAEINYYLERISAAETLCYETIPIANRQGMKAEELYLQFVLGKIGLLTGRYDIALRHFTVMNALAVELEDTEYLVYSLNCLGGTHYKLKDYKLALNFYLTAIEMARSFGRMATYDINTNIALCYAYLNNLVEARLYLEAAVQECGSRCRPTTVAGIEYASGQVALLEGLPKTAEEHFSNSYELAMEIPDTRYQLDNIYMLAKLYVDDLRFKEAEDVLMEAEKLIDRGSVFNLENIKIYYRLTDFYIHINDYRKALAYQSKYVLLKDSVYNEGLINGLMKAEAIFSEKENAARIASQSQLIQINNEVIRRQGLVNKLAWGLVFVSVCLIFVVLRSYQHRKRINLLLEKRIGERTRELQVSHSALLAMLCQHNLLTERVFSDIQSSFRQIDGLCRIGLMEEPNQNSRSCFRKIGSTSARVSRIITSHQAAKKKLQDL